MNALARVIAWSAISRGRQKSQRQIDAEYDAARAAGYDSATMYEIAKKAERKSARKRKAQAKPIDYQKFLPKQ